MATHELNPTIPTTPVLYLALELGSRTWTVSYTHLTLPTTERV